MQYFERNLYKKIVNQIDDKEFIIIAGARQTGKTTILKQIVTFLENRNDKVYDITLEDISILSKLNEHPENIFTFIPKPKDNKKIFVLIDEIQYLENPTNFLKLLYDKYFENLKIIATGSSAFYIDTKFKDSLAGSKQLFELSTLSFDEFLYFKTGNNSLREELAQIRENEQYLSLKRNEIAEYFKEYLIFGSYPAVVLTNNNEKKISILKELLNSYVKRDISEANIQNQEKFYFLMKLLAEQTGNLLNTNELVGTLGLSTTSVNNYLYVLRKCFHIDLLKPFYKNMRKELTKMTKIYFNDFGMRNILLNNFQTIEEKFDKGAILENYLFLRLKDLYSIDNLHYWRTTNGNEIDFIVSIENGKNFAIECKFNSTNFNPKQYSLFSENYPEIQLQCRSINNESNCNWALAV